MSISEAERHTLVSGLTETLGTERTQILMKCILPDGWQHLATKQDVEVADARMRGEFGELRGEFGELRGYIDSALAKQTRTYLLALVGLAVTVWLTLLLPAVF
ncbi:MAG: hypothetical protein F4110_14655 [Acidimicrobiaceae bacterium]|nr:hypothetical protein [Acidimicrobiaceae bacterium]MXZ99770.1 hypothetical protein [Acidimicrobiaceae bacterium]MYE97103.1 hypothetical protein [Acidimicrobiaceae bacterium]MYH44895.1 hypothetical protein [Acidimicrobiaceae bacterium]MYI55196.1 hypothetical protein [Acidimicrobiaceae bacterium]